MSNTGITTTTEDRALALLGQGIAAELVANACGVDPSRISQLISDPEFSRKLADVRFQNLSKHNARDAKYDSIEDALLERLEAQIPMMYEPMKIVAALSRVNGAVRRGASTPDSIQGTKEVVSLTLPTVLIQQFTQNIHLNQNNQVVKAGEQDLVTVQSVQMSKLLAARKGSPNDLVIENSSARSGEQQAA